MAFMDGWVIIVNPFDSWHWVAHIDTEYFWYDYKINMLHTMVYFVEVSFKKKILFIIDITAHFTGLVMNN